MIQKFKEYQFLLEELTKRDFKIKYKGTFFGMAWSVLSPLLTLLVMKIVFTNFFGAQIPHYTTYLFCGNIIFSYFSESTSQGMTSLLGNAHIFSKVNVPKYLFLFAKNSQTLLNFLLTLIVFVLLCLFDGVFPTWRWIMLLYPIIMLVLFNLGCGLILSALHMFFRDMQYLWTVFVQLLMYASAIFYDINTFPAKAQNLFLLNPVYLFIRYFRKIVIDLAAPDWRFHLLMLIETALVVGIGAHIYKKYNNEFIYYI